MQMSSVGYPGVGLPQPIEDKCYRPAVPIVPLLRSHGLNPVQIVQIVQPLRSVQAVPDIRRINTDRELPLFENSRNSKGSSDSRVSRCGERRSGLMHGLRAPGCFLYPDFLIKVLSQRRNSEFISRRKYHGRAEARPHASVETRAMLSVFHDLGGTAPGKRAIP